MNATGCTCPMPRLSSDKPFQHEPSCPVLGQISPVANPDKTPQGCPDNNPCCDGTDLLHGYWCKEGKMTSDQAQAVEAWQNNQRLRDELAASEARVRELTEALRAVEPFVMVPSDTHTLHYEALGEARAKMRAVLNSENIQEV